MKSKEQKHIEAEVRQDEYNALSLQERLALISNRPGRSVREHDRLWKQIGGNG